MRILWRQSEVVSFSLVGGKKLDRGSEKLTTPHLVCQYRRECYLTYQRKLKRRRINRVGHDSM